MAYLQGSPATIFKKLAEASSEGSQDEALFSGLAKLAFDIGDLDRSLSDLKREVSSIGSAVRR